MSNPALQQLRRRIISQEKFAISVASRLNIYIIFM